MEILILSILRLTIPLTIIKYPLLGLMLAIGIDAIDWHFFPFGSSQDYIYYQIWDKLLDLYFMTLALYVALSWKDKLAKNTLIILFLVRVLGVFLAATFLSREIYMLFPNIFIGFFIFTVLFMKIKKTTEVFTSKAELFLVLVALTLPMIIGEYFVHYIGMLPWQFEWGNFLNKPELISIILNQAVWFMIFLSLPIFIFIWKLKKS